MGIIWSRPGIRATNSSKNRPWKKLLSLLVAPASMLALERTISEIIGRPPMAEARRLPTPTASRSLSRLLARLAGSIESTASTLSKDSTEPTRANITMYLIEMGLVIIEKSGKASALSRLPGSCTRLLGPRLNTPPNIW